ncbi:HEAT repeat domain-containing protein [Paenibacillus sp. 481]|uniref:HEAT repeat domain-containing protein n=1 Tax=Paenibacillus sp. 481 TaxID=2835869 RepID=UPI001E63F10F|nr:HEAT repeat domain-containing protein [Paenibacillus sp. 481]UHA75888.1 HEAT repeat domain-containing protein [Paenibacillus sp. 481]
MTELDAVSKYDQLKASANRSANWRERLEAVQQLGKLENKQTIDVLTHRMNNDTVYQVQEAAYEQLKQLGVDVQLPPKKKGDLIKGISKILLRIKKSLPQGHSFEQFKEKLQKMRSDVYDIYEGEKGADFDQWLEETWASLATK